MSQPLAADTAPAAEARQMAFFQHGSPAERLALTFDLIAFTVASARAAIRRAHPQLEPLEQVRLMVAAQFGESRAAQVQCQWAAVLSLGELLEAALQGVRSAGPPEPPQQQRLF